MKYFISEQTNPKYNLALEEYLFSNAEEDIFMLWRNKKSVIIGKNQNAFAEVDLNYTQSEDISVVRRITGGGAVFHDLGNVNYTFITPNSSEQKDFYYFTKPIISAISDLGLEIVFSGRNDLTTIDGRKISGTARCEKDGRIMHHGTLLFSADMSHLAKALLVNPEKIKSKGIKSVKSRVANICDLLPKKIEVLEFISLISKFVIKMYDCEKLVLSESDLLNIEFLKRTKYDTDEWNLSTNLPFEKENTSYFQFGLLSISHTIKGGFIENFKITGDFFGKKDICILENLIIGCKYTKKDLSELLSVVNLSDFITGATAENIISLIFN